MTAIVQTRMPSGWLLPPRQAAQEEKPDKRPSCGYKVTVKDEHGFSSRKPCGSEERIFNVTGKTPFTGRKVETPVCGPHIEKAWKEWQVDEARPIDLPSRK